MAHFQSHQKQPQVATDEYGNPIPNPTVHHSNPVATATTATRGLHRSGSSSSSSSEEDENGVRRKKKGMKEKIKEKIPGVGGGHHDQHSSEYATPNTAMPGGSYEQHHEKKGMMDKIKDKIPGTGTHHHG